MQVSKRILVSTQDLLHSNQLLQNKRQRGKRILPSRKYNRNLQCSFLGAITFFKLIMSPHFEIQKYQHE